MFGQPVEVPQTERTPFAPTTPYATSKVFAYWIAMNHRTHYGIFVTNGILFNHESSRRGMHSHLSAPPCTHAKSIFIHHVKMTAEIVFFLRAQLSHMDPHAPNRRARCWKDILHSCREPECTKGLGLCSRLH